MFKYLKFTLYWIAFLLYYTAIILAIGSTVGAILFPTVGPFFVDLPFFDLLKKGLWTGFRYSGVWAGGVAIVLCFIRGRRQYLQKHN